MPLTIPSSEARRAGPEYRAGRGWWMVAALGLSVVLGGFLVAQFRAGRTLLVMALIVQASLILILMPPFVSTILSGRHWSIELRYGFLRAGHLALKGTWLSVQAALAVLAASLVIPISALLRLGSSVDLTVLLWSEVYLGLVAVVVGEITVLFSSLSISSFRSLSWIYVTLVVATGLVVFVVPVDQTSKPLIDFALLTSPLIAVSAIWRFDILRTEWAYTQLQLGHYRFTYPSPFECLGVVTVAAVAVFLLTILLLRSRLRPLN